LVGAGKRKEKIREEKDRADKETKLGKGEKCKSEGKRDI